MPPAPNPNSILDCRKMQEQALKHALDGRPGFFSPAVVAGVVCMLGSRLHAGE